MASLQAVSTHQGVSKSGMVYERRGSGRPVILIHGWCLNRRMWDYAEYDLLSSYDVITVDLPGFGQSGPLAGPYSLSRFGDEIVDLITELQLDDVVLIGFAFGAAVCLEVGSRDGTRVSKIISIAVPSAECSPYSKMTRAMLRDWPDFARRSAVALFHNNQSEATLSWLERMFCATALPVAIDVLGFLASYRPADVVSKVVVETLFLHADQDSVAPLNIGEACVQQAPHFSLKTVANCGHLIVLDNKSAFHAAAREFLAADSAPAKSQQRKSG